MSKRHNSPQNGLVDVKTDKDSHTPRTGHTEAAGRQNEAYTPTTEEVRSHYAAHRLVTLEGDDNDLPTSYVVRRLDQVYGPEFDRWLRKVKAEAWYEGHQRGWMDAMESVQADTAVSRALAGFSPNPYESEEA
jgi:superfamily II DNA/RNA helicase